MPFRRVTVNVVAAPPAGTPAWYGPMISRQWVPIFGDPANPNTQASKSASMLDERPCAFWTDPGDWAARGWLNPATFVALGNINAYSSGFLHTEGFTDYQSVYRNGTWLMEFGGGHGDCHINAIFAFGPLESDAPAWTRVMDTTHRSSIIFNQPGVAGPPYYLDGKPAVPHTGDGLVYAPSVNRMYNLNAKSCFHDAGSGSNYPDCNAYKFNERAWTPEWPAAGSIPHSLGAANGVATDYDPYRNCVWRTTAFDSSGIAQLAKLDLNSNQWTYAPSLVSLFSSCYPAFRLNRTPITGAAAYRFGCGQTGVNSRNGMGISGIWMIDLDTFGTPSWNPNPRLISTNNDPVYGAPPLNENCSAFDWDDHNGRYVLGWALISAQQVAQGTLLNLDYAFCSQMWALNPPSNPLTGGWTWQRLYSGTGVPCWQNSEAGPLGRFRRLDLLNGVHGFICHGSSVRSVYFFKD